MSWWDGHVEYLCDQSAGTWVFSEFNDVLVHHHEAGSMSLMPKDGWPRLIVLDRVIGNMDRLGLASGRIHGEEVANLGGAVNGSVHYEEPIQPVR